MDKQELLEKYDIRCRCGKRSVDFDSWFNWEPCEDHKHLTPVQYSRLEDKRDANML
jgi:hypothetical protein